MWGHGEFNIRGARFTIATFGTLERWREEWKPTGRRTETRTPSSKIYLRRSTNSSYVDFRVNLVDVKLEIDAIRAMEERKGGRKEEKKMWWIECIRNRFVLDGRTDVVSRTLTPLFFLPIVPNLYYNSFRKSFVLLFKAGSYVHIKRIENSKFCLTAIRIGVNLLALMPKLIFFDTGERTLDLRTRIYTRNMYIYILDVYLY